MRNLFTRDSIIVVLIMALVLISGCTPTYDAHGQPSEPPTSSMPASGGQSPEPRETGSSPTPTDNPAPETSDNPASSTVTPESDHQQDDIDIITNDEELEAYFNSISDEEIEELFKIIEDIDISPEIGVDNDPGFEDIIIP